MVVLSLIICLQGLAENDWHGTSPAISTKYSPKHEEDAILLALGPAGIVNLK